MAKLIIDGVQLKLISFPREVIISYRVNSILAVENFL